MLARPDLAVRVRVAGAHHGALVLKNLHVVDEILPAQFAGLIGPGANDFFDFGLREFGQSQIVARRETHDTAEAGLGFGD